MNEIRERFMRATELRTALLVLLTAAVFDRLFWTHDAGVNVVVFSVLILVILVARRGWRGISIAARFTALGLICSNIPVVLHGSFEAVCVSWVALFAFTALVHAPTIRGLDHAIPQSVVNWLVVPITLFNVIQRIMKRKRSIRAIWSVIRIGLIPLLIGAVYFQLYSAADPWFEELTAGVFDRFGAWLERILDRALTPHMVFFAFACVLSATLLVQASKHFFARKEALLPDDMVIDTDHRKNSTELAQERQRGVVMLVIVNMLLLCVNIIDIDRLWFGYTVPPAFDLKQFVHAGTWVLILSIVLSLIIIAFLFRGEQNFDPRAHTMRKLANFWMIQNALLAVSVFMRNYHYISFHGLAFGRISVIAFLVVVMFGTLVMVHKIQKRKTLHHWVRLNAWAAFVVLVAHSCIDHDRMIAAFNLHHDNPAEIDIDHYLALDHHVLPLLYENEEVIQRQMRKHRANTVQWVHILDPLEFRERLDSRRDHFIQRFEEQGWQSWTLADQRAYHALKVQLEHAANDPS